MKKELARKTYALIAQMEVHLEYDQVEMQTQVVFTLYPNDHKYDDEMDILHFEIMDDEIPDIGQIFG